MSECKHGIPLHHVCLECENGPTGVKAAQELGRRLLADSVQRGSKKAIARMLLRSLDEAIQEDFGRTTEVYKTEVLVVNGTKLGELKVTAVDMHNFASWAKEWMRYQWGGNGYCYGCKHHVGTLEGYARHHDRDCEVGKLAKVIQGMQIEPFSKENQG